MDASELRAYCTFLENPTRKTVLSLSLMMIWWIQVESIDSSRSILALYELNQLNRQPDLLHVRVH